MATILIPAEEHVLARLLPELVRLSPAARLEAVSQLVTSIQTETVPEAHEPRIELSGTWADNGESAEELAASIRAARSSTKPPIDLN